MAEKEKKKVYIKNRRASFDYEFLERYTAGIVLVGTEIKSVRAGKASLSDAFCYFDTRGQLYVKGMNIAQYFWGSWGQHQPERDRKLLLTKKELRHLQQADKQRGPYDCRRQHVHCRQWLREGRHCPCTRKERIRQAPDYQRE